MRNSRPLVFAAALAASLAGAAVAASAQGTNLRVGIQDDPDALDPATSGTYAGRFVFAAMCDKLVDIAPDLTIAPQLAQSWEWAPDQKAITFKLRPGVKFHDGTSFDAEAVKFNIERMLTMKDSRRKAELSAVAGVEVVAPDQVRLTLKEPFAPLLSVLSDRAGMMVSPAAGAKDDFANAPVCAGPYKFVERKARDLIKLTKFADYWDAANYGYDRVAYYYVPDSTVRLSRVRAGDLDRAIINRVAFNGEYTADNQMIPPSDPFHSKAHPVPARDVAAAKALMAQAGVTSVPVEITFENALTDARVAQIVQ